MTTAHYKIGEFQLFLHTFGHIWKVNKTWRICLHNMLH